jgi:uracil-DNA glycosylase family 4
MDLVDKAVSDLIEVAKNHKLYENILKTDGKLVISRGNLHEPEFLFIGEAPGQQENKVGVPFIGRSGKLLDNWMSSLEITNFVIVNTLPIIPLNSEGGIRKPSREEIDFFRPYVDNLIKAANPKCIVCLGKSALEYLRKSIVNTEWQENIGFIYHPAYYLRNGRNGLDDFERLLKNRKSDFGSKSQRNLAEF